MCNNKCNDSINLFVSVLAAIGLTIIAFFGIFTAFVVGQWIAVGVAVLALVVLTIISTSLLRQDRSLNRCVSKYGNRLSFASLALLVIALISLLIPVAGPVVVYITIFVVAGLTAYVILTLYCLIRCFISSCRSLCEEE